MMAAMLLLALLMQDEPERLIERLASDDLETRSGAADALVKLGEKAVPALVRALDHGDAEVRSRAHDVLYRMCGQLPPEVIDRHPRVKALRVRREVDDLLKEMQAERLTSLGHCESPALYLAHFPKYARLVEIGKPAVGPLVETMLHGAKKPEMRYFAALLLGRIGDAAAIGPLVSLLGSEVSFAYSAG